jgi:hypothetical protein
MAVASANGGEQERTLNAAALKIGALIAGGEIAESDALELLTSAGLAMTNSDARNPWTHIQIDAKIRRGFEHGAKSPRSGTSEAERLFINRLSAEHADLRHSERSATTRHQIHYLEEREFEAVDAAIAALVDSSIYQRGGLLTHIAADLAPDRAIRREKETPRICVATPARLRDELSKCADWTKTVWGKEGKSSERTIAVPRNVVEAVIARDAWPGIRALHGIADFPIVRPDGVIVSVEGYDSATGVYVAPSCSVASPNGSAADLAAWVLDELVGDFPFASPAHRSSWFAALLTPIARHAFEGPSPLILIDKNVRGSGGSLLADLIGIVCSGRAMPRMGQQTDEYQETNRLLGLAVAGDPFALIDNVNQPLGNGALDRVLTGTSLKERWLGGNKIVTASWNCLLLATGNNIQLIGDTARRALHVRLESPEEAPEDRSGFRHANLKGWVRDNRGRLLGALLAILSGYLTSGAKPPKPWGSFEGWSDVVRGAVIWCGLPDPYEGRSELVAVDSDAETVRALMRGLEELKATSKLKAVTVRDLLDNELRPPAMTAALSAIDDKRDSKRIGSGIRKFKGRVIDGKRLATCPHTSQNVAAWYVTT